MKYIYEDFKLSTKIDFIDKWQKFYIGSEPIEIWFEECLRLFVEYHEALKFIVNTDKNFNL